MYLDRLSFVQAMHGRLKHSPAVLNEASSRRIRDLALDRVPVRKLARRDRKDHLLDLHISTLPLWPVELFRLSLQAHSSEIPPACEQVRTVFGPGVLLPNTIEMSYLSSSDNFGALPSSFHDIVKPVPSNVPPAAGDMKSTPASVNGVSAARRGRMAKGRRMAGSMPSSVRGEL